MLGNPGSYANKKRKKPVLKQKKINGATEVVKSNPSKRHRDRLNGELDRLTDLLPFPDDVRSRLDKLSVLRLSVGYLRVKSYFKATMKSSKSSSLMFPGVNGQNGNKTDIGGFSEGDILLQALNGFVMVVTSDGSVFYTSDTIKEYLGFQQSDVVHQSVFDLIHTDDRATFRQQLHFALNPPSVGEGDVVPSNGTTVMYNPEQLPPENSSFLERSFVCRFRCLLDNSSGFLALKFQGRLKYLHGQRVLRDNGTCNKSQLALFTIATPVQPPAIVEIRAKMLLFQTKHKLDFTPMGIDSRGKVILGYSETELCMKGSGYQFIHAADMMHCADNHLRMIKTGETGLTVFRLLSKSGGWVWVKSNAKLIFKGGRPEFIIAYQRALVNAEGEEFLRQRQLQLPFSFTTGEAVLYNTGPTVDLKQFQMDKMFGVDNSQADVTPGSLLDCFLKQDKSVYTRTIDPPVPADQVFIDTHALVSVGSDTWQDSGSTTTTGESVVVKEEAKQSVMAVINNMEKMAQNGDFSTALQNLDVGSEELMEWESALKRLSQGDNQQNDVRSELDSVLTNDIFDYIDSVLFKEKGEDCLDASPPACLTTVNNNNNNNTINQQAVNGQLFNAPSPDCTYSPTNGLYAHQPNTMNGAMITGQSLAQSAPNPIFNGTQKLSHRGPLVADSSIMPPLQQLQLQDIFTPSIELPELTIPDAPAAFQSCRQQQASLNQMAMLGQTQSNQQLLMQCPQNGVQAPVNGLFLQSSVKQPNSVVAPIQGVMDILPPLIPCSDFKSCTPPNIPIPFATACLQGTPASLESQQQVQQWPQTLPNTAGLIQNGHELMLASHSQNIDGQIYPLAFPRSAVTTNGLNHAQQGRLACGQAANQYMYNQQHFSSPSAPQEGQVLAFNGTLGHTSLDQSPPQGSCYFQWSRSEPIVGSTVINQENANISPISMPNNMAAPSSSSLSAEHAVNMQRYLECHRQSHVNMSHCGLDPFTQQQ